MSETRPWISTMIRLPNRCVHLWHLLDTNRPADELLLLSPKIHMRSSSSAQWTLHPHPKMIECHSLTSYYRNQAFLHVLKTTLQTYKKHTAFECGSSWSLVRASEGCYLRPCPRWGGFNVENGDTQPSLDAVDEGEVDSQPSPVASSGAPVWGAGGHRTQQGANQRDHHTAEPARWHYGSKCLLLVSES